MYLRKLYLQLIFEFLLVTCAKNCKNWWIYFKPIAMQSNVGHFSRHSVVATVQSLYCPIIPLGLQF